MFIEPIVILLYNMFHITNSFFNNFILNSEVFK
jgi:hypothetical protein